MTKPYFNRKSFLRVLPQVDVDALQTTFERTGGSSLIVFDQSEIIVLLEDALSSVVMVRKLREDIESLKREVEALR